MAIDISIPPSATPQAGAIATATPAPDVSTQSVPPSMPVTPGQAPAAPRDGSSPAEVSFASSVGSGNSATKILRGALAGMLGAATRSVLGSRSPAVPSAQPPRTGGALQKVGGVVNGFLKAQPAYQQRLKNQDEHMAALDDATAKKVVNNYNAMRALHEFHQDQYESWQNSQTQQAATKLRDTQRRADMTALSDAGITFNTDHGTGAAGLTGDHAKDVANGNTSLIFNGETGEEKGFATVDNNFLPPLEKTAMITSGWTLDPKTGALSPKTVTLPVGTSGADALALLQHAAKQHDDLLKQYDDQLNRQKTQAETANSNAEAGSRKTPGQVAAESKAEIGQKNAAAAKDNAETKLTAALNAPGAQGTTGVAYIKTLPPAMQGPVQAIAEGRLELSPRLLATKSGQAYVAALTRAYPDWDQSKGQTWFKARNEYTGTGQSAKTSVAYNAALEHMAALSQSSTAEGLYNPLSKDWQDRQVQLNFVTQEVGKAVHNGVLPEADAKQILSGLKGMTPGTSRERVAETARLLHDKLEEFQNKFADAAPSSAVQVPNLISPKAAQSYDVVTGKAQQPQAGPQQKTPPAGATGIAPGPDGQNYYHDANGNNLGKVN